MNKDDAKAIYEKTLVIPIDKTMWKTLKYLSFNVGISMSQIARDALKKEIKKYQKIVDIEL